MLIHPLIRDQIEKIRIALHIRPSDIHAVLPGENSITLIYHVGARTVALELKLIDREAKAVLHDEK